MAKLGYDADPTDLPEGGEYELLTPGDYPMQAIACEIKDTKKGGQMSVWEFVLIDGAKAGRKIWDQQNIVNPPGYVQTGKADPARIGIQHNNQFAAAIGLTQGADDTDNYLFKPVIGVVTVEKGTNGYADKNVVKAFKPASGGAVPRGEAKTGAATGGGAAAQSGGSGKPIAMKNPDDGKWYDEGGNVVPFFKLSQYDKIDG